MYIKVPFLISLFGIEQFKTVLTRRKTLHKSSVLLTVATAAHDIT